MAFKRMEGFAGSIPQQFADTQIPKCPMCGTTEPYWTLDQRMGKMFSLDPEENAHKYLFKCDKCQCVLRVPTTDVVGVGRSALLSWQGVAKKLRGKDTSAVYVTIEEVGNMQTTEIHKGKEMTLHELTAMAYQL